MLSSVWYNYIRQPACCNHVCTRRGQHEAGKRGAFHPSSQLVVNIACQYCLDSPNQLPGLECRQVIVSSGSCGVGLPSLYSYPSRKERGEVVPVSGPVLPFCRPAPLAGFEARNGTAAGEISGKRIRNHGYVAFDTQRQEKRLLLQMPPEVLSPVP